MAKYTKRPDGRYATSIIIGHANGKPQRKFFYGNTVRELEDKVAEFKSLQNKGIVIDDEGMLLQDWATQWLELYKSQKSYNTYSMYKNAIDKHINPAIGNIRMKQLKKHNIQELLNKLTKDDHYRSAEIVKLTMKQIVSAAIDEQYIYVDITRGLSLPKKPRKEKRALTDTEYDKLKNARLTPKQRLFVDILLYTGLRRGEALALTPNDIDLGKRTISVNKTLIYKGNEPVIKQTPKSNASLREVVIPDILLESITDNLPHCGSEYIFTMEKSDKLITQSSYTKFWAAIAKAAELPNDVTAHILRHNFATKLYYGGVDVKTAQKLLGHANIQITLDIYTHLADDNNETTDKINSIF